MDNVKILNVQWFNDIGMVTIDNGYEVKTYIKKVNGINEDYDILDVLDYGVKVYPDQLEKILSFYKTGENDERTTKQK